MARHAGSPVRMTGLTARKGAPGFPGVSVAPLGFREGPARVAVLTLVEREVVIGGACRFDHPCPGLVFLMRDDLPAWVLGTITVVAVHALLLRMTSVALFDTFTESLEGVNNAETSGVSGRCCVQPDSPSFQIGV